MSPDEYKRRQRSLQARKLLLETRAPLAEIALEAGFCDQSHLARWFRR